MNSKNSLHELGWILSVGSSLLINKINFALQVTVVVTLKRCIQLYKGLLRDPVLCSKKCKKGFDMCVVHQMLLI